MTKRKKTEIVGLKLRLRESLRRQIEAAAKAQERSLNSEVIARLEESFDREGLTKIRDQAGELLRLVKEHLRGEQRTPYRQETTLPDFVEQALREADNETDEQRQARLRLEEEIYQETMAGRLKAALGRAPTGDELNTAIAVTRRMPLRPNDPRLWEMVLGAVKDPRRSIMAQPRNRQAK